MTSSLSSAPYVYFVGLRFQQNIVIENERIRSTIPSCIHYDSCVANHAKFCPECGASVCLIENTITKPKYVHGLEPYRHQLHFINMGGYADWGCSISSRWFLVYKKVSGMYTDEHVRQQAMREVQAIHDELETTYKIASDVNTYCVDSLVDKSLG